MVTNLGFSIDHFFIGKNGTKVGAPPDRFFVHIGKASLEELEENPLGPLVVARIGRVNLSIPVDGKPYAFDLPAEVVYISLGGDGRVGAGFDRILLCWKSKSVPTHGMEHIITTGLFIACQNVGSDIPLGVANMQASSGWIGEHIQSIVLGLV